MYIIGITREFDDKGPKPFYYGRNGYFHSGPNRHDGSHYFTVHVGKFLVNVTEYDLYELEKLETDLQRQEYLDLRDRREDEVELTEEYW